MLDCKGCPAHGTCPFAGQMQAFEECTTSGRELKVHIDLTLQGENLALLLKTLWAVKQVLNAWKHAMLGVKDVTIRHGDPHEIRANEERRAQKIFVAERAVDETKLFLQRARGKV